MSLVIATLIVALLMALMALGVFFSFRLMNFPDLTAEGIFIFAGALIAVLLHWNVSPWVATAIAMVLGGVAGMITGLLWQIVKINPLLAGLLTMTGLFFAAAEIMGQNSIQLFDLHTIPVDLGEIFPSSRLQSILYRNGWNIECGNLFFLLFVLVMVVAAVLVLWWFFHTPRGMLLRTARSNPESLSSLGAPVGMVNVFGLAIAGTLEAAGGALFAQFNGIADIQSSFGLLVVAIAGILTGEVLWWDRSPGGRLLGVVFGTVILWLFLTVLVQLGWGGSNIKIFAGVVLLLLLLIESKHRLFRRKPQGGRHAPTG